MSGLTASGADIQPHAGCDWTGMDARFSHLARLSGGPLVAGVSGGGDSMALAGLLAAWSARTGEPAHALVLDHGLQSGSDRIALQAAARCMELGLDATVLTWTPGVIGSGLQARARDARHRLLGAATCNLGSRVLLLAQTSDDQAETVLHRMLRATGPDGLSGIEPIAVSPQWPAVPGLLVARPLLDRTRADLRSSLAEQRIDWHEDPANLDARFTRVRMRQLLAGDPSGTWRDSLIRTADAAGRLRAATRAWLSGWLADAVVIEGESLILERSWITLPGPLQQRSLGLCLAAVAGLPAALPASRVARPADLLAAATPVVTLAGGLARWTGDGLRVSRAPPRRVVCGNAGPALGLPLAVRLAHLAGEIESVIETQTATNPATQLSSVMPGDEHVFMPH